MKKTENDLNMRHLNMMGAHEDIAKHTKDNLMYNNELGHKQITAHITNGTDFSGMSKEEIEIYSRKYRMIYKKLIFLTNSDIVEIFCFFSVT